MRRGIDEWRRRGAPARGSITLAVVALIAIVLLVKYGPAFLAGDDLDDVEPLAERLDAEDAARGRILEMLAGLGALGALWFTARTYLLSREGHVTDRYTKAVDQLGADALAQRVGGVYALGRIMSDSPRDHAAVVAVLTAFVRKQALAPEHLPPVGEAGPAHEAGPRRERRPGPKPPRPDGDVQAALIVLGQRPHRPDSELDALRLSDTLLRRAHLRGARLDCVRLRDSHLEYANMEGIRLQAARLLRARLEYADLAGADLKHTRLTDAHLEHANLTRATLDNATLVRAHLRDATLDKASMVGAHLAGATGAEVLSPEQQRQLHCRPEQGGCREADDLPESHPCARYER
jgi:Pentapeptide repeats (8 copies)